MRRSRRFLRVAAAAAGAWCLRSPSFDISSWPSIYSFSPTDAFVRTDVDLATSRVTMHFPCDALAQAPRLDATSPLLDDVPKFANKVNATTPQCGSSGDERRADLEEFLRLSFPLAKVRVEVATVREASESETGDDDDSDGSRFVARASTERIGRPPCSLLRGRVGRWVRDDPYRNATWYAPGGGASGAWIRSTDPVVSRGYYDRGSYAWESEVCPVDLVTREKFCEVLADLNITRIMALGDSIEFMRTVSLYELLGTTSQAHLHLKADVMRHEQKLDCSSVGRPNVRMVLHRTNHLMPLRGGDAHPAFAEGGFRMFVCYKVTGPQRVHPDEMGCPWVHEYLNDEAGTLLGEWICVKIARQKAKPKPASLNPTCPKIVAGVGPHWSHGSRRPYFRKSFGDFLDLLRSHPRPQDRVVLRTIATGHDNCTTDEDGPYEPPLPDFLSYKERFDGAKRWHDWQAFDEFNRIFEGAATMIRRDPRWIGADVSLLDVFWMTALRTDGHPARNDCLHYLLPGPPDFWNHLLYSNLREMASERAIS